jgi:tetratricopeptide (TPR) repeat protein
MSASHHLRSLLICALLGAVTLSAYWPVLENDFINLDDYAYISKNPHVDSGLTWENVKWSFQAGYSGNWHPLTWLSHMLDVQLFGLNPRWHHLVNLLFHLANTLLLFRLVQGLTRLTWRGALVAALFAVHPLHVESVAWAAERKDVLSTLFFLLTLGAYGRYAEFKSQKSKVKREAMGWYGAALFFFVLGLMSKPMLVTVPLVLLLLDVWPLQRVELANQRACLESLRPLFREKLPFFILSLASCWVTFLPQFRAEAVSAVVQLPLYPRFANAVVSHVKYLSQTFWPAKLAFFYPYPGESDFWNVWQIAGAVLILAAVSFFALYRIKRIPWFATGWFWFLGTLVPVIGIVQVGTQAMADRYTYIPLIGVFICLVWAGAEISASRRLGWKIPAAIGAVVVLACAAATHRQVKYWRDNISIASHALAVTGNNAVAHDILGKVYGDQGKHELAVEHLQAAMAADPAYSMARYDLAVALTRLAEARTREGRLEEAVAAYQSALRVRVLSQTLNNLGLLLEQLGRHEEAIARYHEALRLQPASPEVRFNLATALAGEGKIAEAEHQFAEALRLSPDPLRILMEFGRFLARQGKQAEAMAKFREAARLYPTNAEASLELGVNLTLSGQPGEAARFFSAARKLEPDLAEKNLRAAKAHAENGQINAARRCLWIVSWLKPEDPGAHEELGLFSLRHGWPLDAVEQFEETLRLRPDARSHYHLGLALTILGRTGEAAGHFEIAVKLNPDWPEALNELAWFLATIPDAQLRNGPRAVVLAERACRLTDFNQPRLVDTLAAAYAEAGRFDDAMQSAQKAVTLGEATNRPERVKRSQELLELYRAGKTVRQSGSGPDK